MKTTLMRILLILRMLPTLAMRRLRLKFVGMLRKQFILISVRRHSKAMLMRILLILRMLPTLAMRRLRLIFAWMC